MSFLELCINTSHFTYFVGITSSQMKMSPSLKTERGKKSFPHFLNNNNKDDTVAIVTSLIFLALVCLKKQHLVLLACGNKFLFFCVCVCV